MKRILQCSIVLLVIVIFSANAFAAAKPTKPAEPNYIGTKEFTAMFTIGSNGMAKMTGTLTPKNTTAIDEVKVSFIIERVDEKNVYNRTWNTSWNDLIEEYNVAKEYQLQNKGTYILHTTFKCYKNGRLIETIRADNIRKTYS